MRKRDSIEFLWDELKSFLPANYTVDESVNILSILKQAKAMHKEEMKQTYFDGWHRNIGNRDEDFEQYYNETFQE